MEKELTFGRTRPLMWEPGKMINITDMESNVGQMEIDTRVFGPRTVSTVSLIRVDRE